MSAPWTSQELELAPPPGENKKKISVLEYNNGGLFLYNEGGGIFLLICAWLPSPPYKNFCGRPCFSRITDLSRTLHLVYATSGLSLSET